MEEEKEEEKEEEDNKLSISEYQQRERVAATRRGSHGFSWEHMISQLEASLIFSLLGRN